MSVSNIEERTRKMRISQRDSGSFGESEKRTHRSHSQAELAEKRARGLRASSLASMTKPRKGFGAGGPSQSLTLASLKKGAEKDQAALSRAEKAVTVCADIAASSEARYRVAKRQRESQDDDFAEKFFNEVKKVLAAPGVSSLKVHFKDTDDDVMKLGKRWRELAPQIPDKVIAEIVNYCVRMLLLEHKMPENGSKYFQFLQILFYDPDGFFLFMMPDEDDMSEEKAEAFMKKSEFARTSIQAHHMKDIYRRIELANRYDAQESLRKRGKKVDKYGKKLLGQPSNIGKRIEDMLMLDEGDMEGVYEDEDDEDEYLSDYDSDDE